MSVENERKYILSLTPDHINGLVCAYSGVRQYIQQAYIDDARIRAVNAWGTSNVEWFFTWKKRRPDGSRIEIETEIAQKEYQELWQMSKNFICKQRIKIKGYGVSWDVDFLFEDDVNDYSSHYLTIAEVEMPEGVDTPNTIPDFVKDNLLYLVPRDRDDDWVNPKLTDPEKVRKMLKKALHTEE